MNLVQEKTEPLPAFRNFRRFCHQAHCDYKIDDTKLFDTISAVPSVKRGVMNVLNDSRNSRPSKAAEQAIVAEEIDSDEEDRIPGPTLPTARGSSLSRLDLSATKHSESKRGDGMLANRQDLSMPAEEFAEGCKLLQQAALGNLDKIKTSLIVRPNLLNFRDYDRRTALHVAASEGHLEVCKFLVERGAKVNRSDRWGGSPLDDAHRHRHKEIIFYLRDLGASSGSTNKMSNFITAAADGDVDELILLLSVGEIDLNEGDYDDRTALHLAAGEGRDEVVKVLCQRGANVNVEDRWGNRPLDDAMASKHKKCVDILLSHGAERGYRAVNLGDSSSRRREVANFETAFEELEMIDRIGKGSFGEIYKCRWRGTLVAAKCIKSARIRQEWLKSQLIKRSNEGQDVEDVIRELDVDVSQHAAEEAREDFRREVKVLKSLRHPNIVLLLAYSATEDMEVMVSELMKCSLLDVFKAHIVNGSRMKKRDMIVYATHLAQGMFYLHTCRPPIIHRDLKPANLLIDQSGVLKVADFGLAKVRPDPKKEEKDHFLMTGETGSYRFMAPEVYKHLDYTESVDIYSYAMILFYLLDGRPPWPFDNGLVAVKKASEQGDRPPVPRHWHERLQTLLQEAWHETPSRRPPFKSILKTLNDYARDEFHADSDHLAVATEIVEAKRCNCVVM